MKKCIVTKQNLLHTETVDNTKTEIHIYADEVEIINRDELTITITDETLPLAKLINDSFEVNDKLILPPKEFAFKLNGEVVETVETFHDLSFQILEMELSGDTGKLIYQFKNMRPL